MRTTVPISHSVLDIATVLVPETTAYQNTLKLTEFDLLLRVSLSHLHFDLAKREIYWSPRKLKERSTSARQ